MPGAIDDDGVEVKDIEWVYCIDLLPAKCGRGTGSSCLSRIDDDSSPTRDRGLPPPNRLDSLSAMRTLPLESGGSIRPLLRL